MIMDKRQQLLNSLQDQQYRQEFAAEIGTGLAFQIRLLREHRRWTQEELARQTGKRQETISQWENPNYGHYTLKTLKDLAAAFDVGLVVRFAPFSELVDWIVNLTPAQIVPHSFEEERTLERLWQTWAKATTDDVAVGSISVSSVGNVEPERGRQTISAEIAQSASPLERAWDSPSGQGFSAGGHPLKPPVKERSPSAEFALAS